MREGERWRAAEKADCGLSMLGLGTPGARYPDWVRPSATSFANVSAMGF